MVVQEDWIEIICFMNNDSFGSIEKISLDPHMISSMYGKLIKF